MRKFVWILAIAVITLVMAGPVLAQGKAQTVCPVLGGNVDKNIYADSGPRVYFCCKGCDEEFKKNPEKYLEKMKSQGITPGEVPGRRPREQVNYWVPSPKPPPHPRETCITGAGRVRGKGRRVVTSLGFPATLPPRTRFIFAAIFFTARRKSLN